MSNTRLISLRVPIELLEAIDSKAKQEHRSRAQVIILILSGRGVEGHAPLSDGFSGTHSGTLCQRDREIPCEGGTSFAEQVSSPAAPTKSSSICTECNAMNGLHQRWCSKR